MYRETQSYLKIVMLLFCKFNLIFIEIDDKKLYLSAEDFLDFMIHFYFLSDKECNSTSRAIWSSEMICIVAANIIKGEIFFL